MLRIVLENLIIKLRNRRTSSILDLTASFNASILAKPWLFLLLRLERIKKADFELIYLYIKVLNITNGNR